MIKRKGRGGAVETLHADDVAMSPSSSRPRLYMLYDNASAVLSHVAILLSCKKKRIVASTPAQVFICCYNISNLKNI